MHLIVFKVKTQNTGKKYFYDIFFNGWTEPLKQHSFNNLIQFWFWWYIYILYDALRAKR